MSKQLKLTATFSIFFVLSTLISNKIFAQTTANGIFFQAVARDNFSNPAKDRKIYIESSIIQYTATGTKVLIEQHEATTDETGVFNISLGNGKRIGGSASNLTNIDWAMGPYYLSLKIAITPRAPIPNWDYTKEWIDLGTTPFGTVPYALYAGSAAGLNDKLSIADTTSMLAIYAKMIAVKTIENTVNTKIGSTDTAAMLAPYKKIVNEIIASNITSLTAGSINTALSSKVNVADSAIVYITPMQLKSVKFDTTSIVQRIDTKLDKVTGIAGSATKLATARNINGVAFDGSGDITITSTADAGTLTGTTLKSTVTGSSLTSVGTLTNLTVTNPIAGSITGNAGTATNLTGLTTSVATLNNLSGVNSGDQTTITGNAATATKLAASKTINGVAFDGTADITAPAAAETLTGTTLKSTVTGSSLTSVGTITSGVWSGTAVAIQKGGTGLTTVGTNGQVLTSNGTSITWATASGGSGVPYTGATGAVDLGAYDLKVYGLTIGRGGGNVDGNTANGVNSLYLNTTGYNNTAYGYASLYSNTSGSLNTANGFRSLYSNIASYNTAYGSGSLYSNTTGGYNTANGVNSLYLNTTGSNNTANGLQALYNNTTGGSNTANGVNSLYSNTTGYFNVANGYQSLNSNTTGSQNTADGYQAGLFIANGSTNNTTSDYSVYLGSETKASADNAQNEVVIGYNAIGAGSNTIQLGNTSVTNVKTSGTITAGSITYPSAHGTANQVLSTTGSGTLTWTTPSAGGSGGGTYTIGLNSDLGGYVFFLSTDSKHGLVAETQDQSTPTTWYDAEDKISNQANHSTNGKKFTDWRLPTKHELNLMYSVKNLIGGFVVNYYWSSTEVSSSSVGAQDFRDGYKGNSSKDGTWYVRAVRAF